MGNAKRVIPAGVVMQTDRDQPRSLGDVTRDRIESAPDHDDIVHPFDEWYRMSSQGPLDHYAW